MTIQTNINLYMFRDQFLAKKNIFDERWVFNIFPAKVWAGEELIFTKVIFCPQNEGRIDLSLGCSTTF